MTIEQLAKHAPELREAYDAARPEFVDFLNRVDSWFGAQSIPYHQIDSRIRAEFDLNATIGIRLALKIAESRRLVRDLQQEVTVTLINPVYKETGRMQPRSAHPHGEDSIRIKIEALRALERLNDRFHARLVVVDDECPDRSGVQAEEIIASCGEGPHEVLFLGDAIDRNDPDVPLGLTHKSGSNRSVKGGAVLYAMRRCLRDEVTGMHILVDNDADLSIHPEQIGLLIHDIVRGAAKAVAGSRREPDSVATIGGARNMRGQLFINIWQHFLPELATSITDTTRAFKAFESGSLSQIIERIGTYTFPYQIELLQACVTAGIPLTTCAVGYLDSEAASTQQGENITETYLHQIHQIIAIAKRYNTTDDQDPLLRLFETMSEERWLEIERNPPEKITELVQG